MFMMEADKLLVMEEKFGQIITKEDEMSREEK